MFARRACYAFVRPKRTFLELCIFLGRTERSPRVRRAIASSRTKVAHLVPVRHRDEAETKAEVDGQAHDKTPLTDNKTPLTSNKTPLTSC
jgi:hypothetical protein